jgi:hypothetical protein
MSINLNKESAHLQNQHSSHLFKNLYQLSKLFLRQIGLGEDGDTRTNQVGFVIGFAVKFNPGKCVEQRLQAELSILSEDKRNAISSIFSAMKQELMEERRQLKDEKQQLKEALRELKAKFQSSPVSNIALNLNIPNASEGHQLSEGTSPPEVLPPSNMGRKRKERGGLDNLDAREDVKKARGMERLDLIISLHRKYPKSRNLTESGRNFMNKAVIPVVKCLESHYNNDKQLFLIQWPLTTESVGTFKEKCCNCKSAVCGIN